MLRPAVMVTAQGVREEKGGTEKSGKQQELNHEKAGPDERLKKYGVLEDNKKSPIVLFEEYMKQNKPEMNEAVKDLYEEVKKISLAEEVKNEAIPKEKNTSPLVFDRVLAEYLCTMAKKVNDKFFMTLIVFARLYRDCMNEYGWEYLSKYKPVSAEERKRVFAKSCNAEHVPEACNVFINRFFLKEFPNFDSTIAVDLTMHLCDWLTEKQYSHSKISQL